MKEMTSLERVQAVLHGEIPDRIPVLPQSVFFALHEAGHTVGELIHRPGRMAECLCDCREKYGYDGVILDFDDATLAEACGAAVKLEGNGGIVVDKSRPAITDLRGVDDLVLPDPASSGRLSVWMEAAQRMMERVGDHAFVMGRADQGPFSLLTLLRGEEDFLMDLIEEEEEVILHALEWATEAHIRFACAMREICHATSMGDSYAGTSLISPAMYRKFAQPYEKQVVQSVQTTETPYSIHICGKAEPIIDGMADTEARILEIDAMTDIGHARRTLDAAAAARDILPTVVMGNVDTTLLVSGSPEAVEASAKAVIEATGGRGLILSSGCAMGGNTNPDNMRALVAAAKKYGTFAR